MRFNPITRFTPVVRSIPIFAMTLALAACDGAGIIITPINNSSSSSSASNHSEISESSSSVSSSSQSSDTEITKGISYPKPLTTREFYNSISLILGEDVPVALQDNELLGYHGSPSLPSIEEEAFLKVHQNIQTISESEWVATRIPNHQKGSVSDVADYVLSTLAPLTYRRPLTDDEYKSMHAAILVSTSVDEAIVKAINLLFTSTAFLYRLEIGIVAGGSLDSFEYATALAYIYSGAGPDKDLYDAARKGEL